jgi:hypothetical protein
MTRLAIIAATAGLCLLGGSRTVDSAQSLSLEVSPTVAPGPAFVRVRALVEPNEDNRSLEIVAQSTEFYRSSHVALDGLNSPRMAVVEYPRLPPGRYEITGVLIGTGGRRATAMKLVQLVAGPGSGKY